MLQMREKDIRLQFVTFPQHLQTPKKRKEENSVAEQCKQYSHGIESRNKFYFAERAAAVKPAHCATKKLNSLTAALRQQVPFEQRGPAQQLFGGCGCVASIQILEQG